jgi:3-oxoacyl-[acyl-carrier-protein] synthase II
MGTVNPLGHSVEETWEKICAGVSGIDTIKHFDPSGCSSRIAGEVKDFDFLPFYKEESRKTAKRLDLFVHYAAAALKEALGQSGLDLSEAPERIGMCLGSGLGGIRIQHENSEALIAKGGRRVSPFYIPGAIGNIAAGFLSMEYGIKGPNLATQTACATANHAIGTALLMMKAGMADAFITGGTEATIHEVVVNGFANMRALSTHYNDTPSKASRPFDTGRDGFVIAEGAGILVLEEYEAAKKRGADIICEVCSVGMSGDAYDLVMPDPEGYGAYRSMQMALQMGNVEGTKLNYVNTHGTSTPLGDLAETKAVYKLLKGNEENTFTGSTKSMHGHLLGATAGLEAIICAQAVRENIVPPTINLDEPDKDIPLRRINTQTEHSPVHYALSNSFGFGGHNSSLLLGKI